MLLSLLSIAIKRDQFLQHRKSVESPNEINWAAVGV